MATFKFNYKKEIKQNPFIGFTSFNHFNGQPLFSDKIADAKGSMLETTDYESYPVPAGVEENGRSQGFHPDCSVAYFRVLWKDFEPEQGKYNFKFIQDILDGAKSHNQSVMFRLMPHSTTERDDVPKWLRNIIVCPERPLGQRVKESPRDDKFLYIFADAVKAFAKQFDTNPTLDVVDICLSGAWGEGYLVNDYSPQAVNYLVDAFIQGFKHTKLLGQIARTDYIVKLNEQRPIGWRADGIGKPHIHEVTYSVRVPQLPKDIWVKSPVSFESFWWLTEWKRQGWDVDKIFDWMLDLHVSTFNNKNFPVPFEWKDNVDRFVSKMGYHFVIDSCETNVVDGKLDLSLIIDNVGVAPIYNKIPLKFAIKTENGIYESISDIDITDWLPGKNTIKLSLPLAVEGGKVKVGMGIFNDDTFIHFATDAELDGKYYTIAEIDL